MPAPTKGQKNITKKAAALSTKATRRLTKKIFAMVRQISIIRTECIPIAFFPLSMHGSLVDRQGFESILKYGVETDLIVEAEVEAYRDYRTDPSNPERDVCESKFDVDIESITIIETGDEYSAQEFAKAFGNLWHRTRWRIEEALCDAHEDGFDSFDEIEDAKALALENKLKRYFVIDGELIPKSIAA